MTKMELSVDSDDGLRKQCIFGSPWARPRSIIHLPKQTLHGLACVLSPVNPPALSAIMEVCCAALTVAVSST